MKGKFINYIFYVIVALMTVACYDDSEIWEKFEDVEEGMSELAARIDSLENKMADNIAAIQSMVSVSSIESWSFNVETGKGQITLIDGSVITIDQNIKGYSIITIEKDSDGKYYWAICRDGVNIPLTVDNKRVPVSVTPSLKISSDNEWLISVDGGKTWINTGIAYSYEDGSEEGGSSDVVVFENAETEGGYLVLTLVGGTKIRVAIVGEAVFKAVADTLWFPRCGMEKWTIVEMENVKSFTITEKPEGWKAYFDESYLYVVSPDNFVQYPDCGTVKVFALFDNGALPEILYLEVAHEPVLSLSRANGVVNVTPSEHTSEDFNGYVLAGWRADEYSPETAVMWFNDNYETLNSCSGEATYALSDIVDGYDQNATYVIAAVPYLPLTQISSGKIKYEISDIQTVEVRSVINDWQMFDVGFDYAYLSAALPVPEYYGGISEYEIWLAKGKTDVLELINESSMIPVDVIHYEGPVQAFPDGENALILLPDTEYVVWYVPVSELGVYTETDFVEHTFKTITVAPDHSISAPSCSITDISSSGFSAKITPASSYYKTFGAILLSTAIPESEEELISLLIKMNTFSNNAESVTVSKNSFSPDDEVYLVAVSMKEDGGYGKIYKQKVDLQPLVFTDQLGVSVVSHDTDEIGNTTINLEFIGSPVTLTYLVDSYFYYSESDIQKFMALGQMGNAVRVNVESLGGELTLTGLSMGVNYTFYAIVTDANDNHSYLSSPYEFTPVMSIDYILSDDDEYEYGMPQISGTLSSRTYTMNVEMPDECARYWLFCGDPEYLSGDVYSNSDKLVNMELELSGETMHEDSVTMTYKNVYSFTRIYMVWQDINQKYHAIYEFNPNK